ncbi:hypothetical protein H0W80_04310 [Candidatus Saccharibacteria bacterium]|nr:hypothetical protein [Candidatus Saccharibacteria bacterium]
MKVLVFTTSEEPMDEVLDLLLTQLTERQISYQLLDVIDTNHDAQKQLYDIATVPAIVVCLDDGTATEVWQNYLPSVDQVVVALGLNV